MRTQKTLKLFPRPSLVIMAAAATFVLQIPFHPLQRASYSWEGPRGDIKVTVDEIRYKGSDTYAVEISLMNDSAAEIFVQLMEKRFLIQTDKGWKPAQTHDKANSSDLADFLLGSGTKRKIIVEIRIPLAMPDIFRTYEGDVSLMFRYRLHCLAPLTGTTYLKADETYYWITPLTPKWIHREGM